MDKEFVVLYTHQKQKKAKTWHDGTIKHSGHGTKGVLYDDKGARLDSIYIKIQDLTIGEQIESDRYLILIEELKSSTVQKQDKAVKEAPLPVPQKPASQARCAGLKRKRTGFSAPRMIKHPSDMQLDDSQQETQNYTNTKTTHGYLEQLRSNISDRNTTNYQLSHNSTRANFKSINIPHTSTEVSERDSFVLRQGQNLNSTTSDPNFSGTDDVQQNMLTMYRQFGQCRSSGSHRESSQESDRGTGAQILSPWSVYGSNNSSPSLHLSQSPNTYKSPRDLIDRKSNIQGASNERNSTDRKSNIQGASNERNSTVSFVRSPQNAFGGFSSDRNSVSQDSNSPNIDTHSEHLKQYVQSSHSKNLQSNNLSEWKYSVKDRTSEFPIHTPESQQVVPGQSNEVESLGSTGIIDKKREANSEIQQKRSMTQILSLLRGKSKVDRSSIEDKGGKESLGMKNVLTEKPTRAQLEKDHCHLGNLGKFMMKKLDTNNEKCNDISEGHEKQDLNQNYSDKCTTDILDETKVIKRDLCGNEAKCVIIDKSIKCHELPNVNGEIMHANANYNIEKTDITMDNSTNGNDIHETDTIGNTYLEQDSYAKSPKLSNVKQDSLEDFLNPQYLEQDHKTEAQKLFHVKQDTLIISPKLQHLEKASETDLSKVSPTEHGSLAKSPRSSHLKQDEMVKAPNVSLVEQDEMDDSFGDFSLTFSPMSNPEDKAMDADLCLYENGNVQGTPTSDEIQDTAGVWSEKDRKMKNFSDNSDVVPQLLPGYEAVNADSADLSPINEMSPINDEQYIKNNKAELKHKDGVKPLENICLECRHIPSLCSCNSLRLPPEQVVQKESSFSVRSRLKIKSDETMEKVTTGKYDSSNVRSISNAESNQLCVNQKYTFNSQESSQFEGIQSENVEAGDNEHDKHKTSHVFDFVTNSQNLHYQQDRLVNDKMQNVGKTESSDVSSAEMKQNEPKDCIEPDLSMSISDEKCGYKTRLGGDSQKELIDDFDNDSHTYRINRDRDDLKDNVENESLTQRTIRDGAGVKMSEECDSQATYMTIDTLEYSSGTTDTQTLLTTEDIEKAQIHSQDNHDEKRHHDQLLSYSKPRTCNATESAIECKSLWRSVGDPFSNLQDSQMDESQILFNMRPEDPDKRRLENLILNQGNKRLDKRQTALDMLYKDDIVPQGSLENEDPLSRLRGSCLDIDRQPGFSLGEPVETLNNRSGINDMSTKINARLGNYRISGSLSAAASRKSQQGNCVDTSSGLHTQSRPVCEADVNDSPVRTIYDGLDTNEQVITTHGKQYQEDSYSSYHSEPQSRAVQSQISRTDTIVESRRIESTQSSQDGEDEIYNRLYQARLMYSRTDTDTNLPPADSSPLVPTGYFGWEETSQQSDSPNSLFYSPGPSPGQKRTSCRQEFNCRKEEIKFANSDNNSEIYQKHPINDGRKEVQGRLNTQSEGSKFSIHDYNSEIKHCKKMYTDRHDGQFGHEMLLQSKDDKLARFGNDIEKNRNSLNTERNYELKTQAIPDKLKVKNRSLFEEINEKRMRENQTDATDRCIEDRSFAQCSKVVSAYRHLQPYCTVQTSHEIESSPDVSDISQSISKRNISVSRMSLKKSKWGDYIASDCSDENEIDLKEYQSMKGCVRDYSVIEKPVEVIDRLTQAQHKITLYDAELADAKETDNCDDILNICDNNPSCGTMQSYDHTCNTAKQNCSKTGKNIDSPDNGNIRQYSECVQNSGVKFNRTIDSPDNGNKRQYGECVQNSEVRFNQTKLNHDLTPSFASTDSFDELFVHGDCDFDTDIDALKESNKLINECEDNGEDGTETAGDSNASVDIEMLDNNKKKSGEITEVCDEQRCSGLSDIEVKSNEMLDNNKEESGGIPVSTQRWPDVKTTFSRRFGVRPTLSRQRVLSGITEVFDGQRSSCSSHGSIKPTIDTSVDKKADNETDDSVIELSSSSSSVEKSSLSISLGSNSGLKIDPVSAEITISSDDKLVHHNEYTAEKVNTLGDLDVSLQLFPPSFNQPKPDIGVKKVEIIKSASVQKEIQTDSLMKKSAENLSDSSESSPGVVAKGSRCLKILSKMKSGQYMSTQSKNVDPYCNENSSVIENTDDTDDQSNNLPMIANSGGEAIDKCTDLPKIGISGQRPTNNRQYRRYPQNITNTKVETLKPKFTAPVYSKGVMDGTQTAPTSNINRKFIAPTMTRSVPVHSQQSNPRTISSVVNRTRPDFGNTVEQSVSSTQLHFPCRSLLDQVQNVRRQAVIPECFPSVNLYKQVLIAALTEYINCQLREVAKGYYHALSRVDMSAFTAGAGSGTGQSSAPAGTPHCKCGAQSKMVMVKKQGANQGRYFFTCNASNRNQQCKFFQWADENSRGGLGKTSSKCVIKDANGLNLFMKDSRVHFYGDSQLIIRTKDNIAKYFKAPKWVRHRGESDTIQKKQIILKLPYKGHSALYAKDDLWVVSKSLEFTAGSTFIARSTYHGPTSAQELEIEPLVGYSPSNWPNNSLCHALLAGNASSELSCMENIREHIQHASPPIVTQLLNRKNEEITDRGGGRYQAPRMVPCRQREFTVLLPSEQMDELCQTYIQQYHLNIDQAEAVRRVANMFSAEKNDQLDGILLIHGVFGAGKSYLLSVVVLFLVCVFELLAEDSGQDGCQWKLLISSTTNVAVDRILSGLLDLGFEDFVRVGSVKKIAKSVLPYSVHATGTDSQELRDLQEMLRSGDLTAAEKSNVRKSIEKHRCGENKKKLSRVRVVGATCAACSLSCLNGMEFPLVLLDECSQMTEPTSLLPIARFSCRKLILVGDPKQLAPTIQGVDAAHRQGLEQTMFDRLLLMGHMPTLLRTQYRCHPHISALANHLFYGGMLENGVTDNDRQPLVDFLPTLCVYSVDDGQESCEGAGSFYNEEEAQYVVFLLQVLLSAGLEPAVLGVITLYRAQMARIMDLLAVGSSDTDMKGIQVSTVDAFQGGERDVIILSCVRTNNCGFIDSDKRMNVALTRARHHLLIVGHHGNLSKSILWSKVIHHCKAFENGLQSSKEARNVLQQCMDEFDHQRAVEATESGSSLPASDGSGSAQHKPRGRKRKSTPLEHTSQSSTGDSDKESNPAKVHKRRRMPRKMVEGEVDKVSPELGKDFEGLEQNEVEFEPSVSKENEQNLVMPEPIPSPDFEISDKEIYLSQTEMSLLSIGNSTDNRGGPKIPKNAGRLKPVIFDSDSDSDLPEFNLAKS